MSIVAVCYRTIKRSSQIFSGLKFNATVKWLTIIIGTVGSIGAGIMHYKRSTKSVNVTPVEAVSNGSGRIISVSSAGKDREAINNSKNLPAVLDGLGERIPKMAPVEQRY